MLDDYPDVLSFRQVMEITHVGRNLLLRLLNSGEIPAFKIGINAHEPCKARG